MHQVLLAAIVLLSPMTKHASGAIGAGANVAVFEALCGLISLSKSTITPPPQVKTHLTELATLKKLNMSVSESSWRNLFHKNGAKDQYNDQVPQGVAKGDDWDAKWSGWKEAEKALEKPDTDPDLKAAGLTKPDTKLASAARHAIAALAESAETTAAGALEPPDVEEEIGGSKLKTALRTAAFGADVASEQQATIQNAFGGAATQTRSTACEASTAENKAQTVLAAIACVCMDINSDNVNGARHHKHAAAADWSGSSISLDKLQRLAAYCPPRPTKPITAAELRAAIAAVENKITVFGTDGYLGAVVNNCDGQTANGVCVKFTGYKTNPQTSTANLPWIGKLKTLAAKLEQREKANQKAQEITSIFKVDIKKVKFIVLEAKHKVEGQTTNTLSAAHTGGQSNVAGKPCEEQTSNTTCTADNNCKWEQNASDKSKGTCKPKPGTETTATGTGAKEGEKDKCSAAQTPEACAKITGTIPPDKKAFCGWIDFIEGTGPVTPGCRSSSFLTNNQFALSMVSAAFVALIF
uniref:Variant surface glycoprotein 366 n=1 Tax=Trypanosoma brucei TaxID=5691 RepID=M4T1L0_9TRYP|nr:variant surface glycoprotein 366 [Trypanosoma brucei]